VHVFATDNQPSPLNNKEDIFEIEAAAMLL